MTKHLLQTRALLFDLDGTLADTAPDLGAALNHVLAKAGLPPAPAQQYRQFAGRGAQALMQYGFGPHGQTAGAQQLEAFLEYYRAHIADNTRLFPHTKDSLLWAQNAGYALGVVTNKRTSLTIALLKALGIHAFFTSIVCADTTAKMKPDPLPIRHALQELKVAAANAIMIGDSDTDIKAARAAGVKIICVRFGYHPHFADASHPAPQADALLSSYAQLPATVRQLD